MDLLTVPLDRPRLAPQTFLLRQILDESVPSCPQFMAGGSATTSTAAAAQRFRKLPVNLQAWSSLYPQSLADEYFGAIHPRHEQNAVHYPPFVRFHDHEGDIA